MGWASAGRIFDRVAKTLVDNHVPDEAVTATLADLIRELIDGDWDTLDESIEQFREFPAVMAAFEQAAPGSLECPYCDCAEQAPRDPNDEGAYPGPDPDCECECHE